MKRGNSKNLVSKKKVNVLKDLDENENKKLDKIQSEESFKENIKNKENEIKELKEIQKLNTNTIVIIILI
jgi:hypothetical protein